MSTAEEVPWDLVVEGDILLGARDGKEWEVTEASRESITLTRGDKSHTLDRTKLPPTAIMLRSAQERREAAQAQATITLGGDTPEEAEMAEAVAVVKTRAGGEVVATKEADGPYSVPQSFPDVASLMGHLYLFHTPERPKGDKTPAPPPSGTLPELIKLHDKLHQEGRLPVPHVHSRTFYAELAS